MSNAFPHVVIDSPFDGKADVWATSDTHVGASTKGDINIEPKEGEASNYVTINGVQYTMRLDIHPVSTFDPSDRSADTRLAHEHDGWGCNWHGLSLRRVTPTGRGDRYSDTDPSDAAKRKAWDALLPWLVEFAKSEQGTKLRNEAEIKRLKQEFEAAKQAEAKARQEIGEILKRRIEVGRALDALGVDVTELWGDE